MKCNVYIVVWFKVISFRLPGLNEETQGIPPIINHLYLGRDSIVELSKHESGSMDTYEHQQTATNDTAFSVFVSKNSVKPQNPVRFLAVGSAAYRTSKFLEVVIT